MLLSHYVDLKAIPQEGMPLSEIIGLLMQQLHRYLPEYEGRLAVAFPDYRNKGTLGNMVRLLGSENEVAIVLTQLKQSDVANYVIMPNGVSPVPEEKIKRHVRFMRQSTKGRSDLRRAKRRLSAQGLSEDEIKKRLSNKILKAAQQNYPHVYLYSYTTQQRFVLAVACQVCSESSEQGGFNAYGLSLGATVPVF